MRKFVVPPISGLDLFRSSGNKIFRIRVRLGAIHNTSVMQYTNKAVGEKYRISIGTLYQTSWLLTDADTYTRHCNVVVIALRITSDIPQLPSGLCPISYSISYLRVSKTYQNSFQTT